jgi:hypothetical protein
VSRGTASSLASATGSAAGATDGRDGDPPCGEATDWPPLTVGSIGSAGVFIVPVETFVGAFAVALGAGGASVGVPRCRRIISLAVIGCCDLAVPVLLVEAEFADFPLLAAPLLAALLLVAPLLVLALALLALALLALGLNGGASSM